MSEIAFYPLIYPLQNFIPFKNAPAMLSAGNIVFDVYLIFWKLFKTILLFPSNFIFLFSYNNYEFYTLSKI